MPPPNACRRDARCRPAALRARRRARPALGHDGDAVALLDAQLFGAASRSSRLRRTRPRRRTTGNSSIASGTSASGRVMPRSGARRAPRCRRWAPAPTSRVVDVSAHVGAHHARASSSRPVRVGLTPTSAIVSRSPRREAAGDDEERGRRKVARHFDLARRAARWAGERRRMPRRLPRSRPARRSSAACARCDRGVAGGLDTVVVTFRVRAPRAARADFTCALATGSVVVDAAQRRAAA